MSRRKPKAHKQPPHVRIKWRWLAAVAIAGAAGVLRKVTKPATDATAVANARRSSFETTIPNKTAPPVSGTEGMVWIPGDEFAMGSESSSEGLCCMAGVTSDALPVQRVYVDGFWMDETDVTNE